MTTPSPVTTPEHVSDNLYALDHVSRTYRVGPATVRAVNDISLEIAPGEFVAVCGSSGSGKTTLLQLLGGLDRPTDGALTFDGTPMRDLGDRALTRLRSEAIGFVFQNFNLVPTLTAAENIEAALAPSTMSRRERRERATNVLDQVGLADRSSHVPTRLSGGEQQRVAIARALAHTPRVILADEPTGNLDSATADEVMGVLTGLGRDLGVTIVIVTHDERIAGLAHRLIRMRDGRVTDDDRTTPSHHGHTPEKV